MIWDRLGFHRKNSFHLIVMLSQAQFRAELFSSKTQLNWDSKRAGQYNPVPEFHRSNHFHPKQGQADLAQCERLMQQGMKPTVKYSGGIIQVWGCFGFSGTSDSHRMNWHTDQREVPLYSSEACLRLWLEIVWKWIHFPAGQWPQTCGGAVPGLFEVRARAKSADLHGFRFAVTRRQPYPDIFGNIWKCKRWRLL